MLAGDLELVKDIRPLAAGSEPFEFVQVGAVVYFSANDGQSGKELWKSDGTEAGTVRVKDIYPGSFGSNPRDLVEVSGTLYFSASDGGSGVELWKSDGTEVGTVRVKDIKPLNPSNPTDISSNPTELTNVGGTVYFIASDGVSARELWKSDGTESGTVLVKDIGPDRFGGFLSSLTNVGGTLFFSASDNVNGQELWKSDGTEAGTVLVQDIYPGGSGSYPTWLTDVGGTLYFVASDGISGAELWRSNGTSAGTVRVKDINSIQSSTIAPLNLTEVGGILYFSHSDGVSGVELWKSDGTATGTVRVKDINPGEFDSSPTSLTNVSGTLYFVASDFKAGFELWKSDGTEAGTIRVKDLQPGFASGSARYLTDFGGTLYFRSTVGNPGQGQLWKTDGTESGTVPVQLAGGIPLDNPYAIAAVGNRLFVAGSRPEIGPELFTLSFGDPLPGDYDLSGVVDELDGAFWSANYGAFVGVGLQADGNGDGVVDAADYTVWRDIFETSSGTMSGSLSDIGLDTAAVDAALESLPIAASQLTEVPVNAPVRSPFLQPARSGLSGSRVPPPSRSDLLLVAQSPNAELNESIEPKIAANLEFMAGEQSEQIGSVLRGCFAPAVRRSL